MKIRRYMGSNVQEAILKVKMDLGNDALILNTRKVRQKGLFKIFSKPMVEVLAAIDDNYGAKKDKEPPAQEDKLKTDTRKEAPRAPLDEKEQKIEQLENKVSSMESMLSKIYEQIQQPVKETAAAAVEPKQNTPSKINQVFHSNLIRNEVDPELAKRILDSIGEKTGINASVNETASVLYNIISGMLGKPETIGLKDNGKPTVAIFLGPTGVGKTTTLAKIAACYLLNHKKSVGLITADTYRIAAVEQLKTYAEILGMPVSVIYSPGEIKDAIKQYSDKDLILIDTAGRSHKNKAQFEELKSLVYASEADEVFLVLSATTSARSCREILSNYDFLKSYKLIFTKIDEAPTTGIILNTRILTDRKLSYITTGQSVPDDIEVANIDKLTKNIIGSIN
jgi:flagellar biosynthesis protein FlhF